MAAFISSSGENKRGSLGVPLEMVAISGCGEEQLEVCWEAPDTAALGAVLPMARVLAAEWQPRLAGAEFLANKLMKSMLYFQLLEKAVIPPCCAF